MKDFCIDNFWDSNLTWGNHRTHPELTQCFQNTVIQCLGGYWLLVALPLYLYVLTRKYKSDPLPRSWISTTKQCIAVVQISIRWMQLRQTMAEIESSSTSYWNSTVFGLVVELVSLILVMSLVELERIKRFVTSGVLSLYWIFATLSTAVMLYSAVVSKDFKSSSIEAKYLSSFVGLAIAQFGLCFYPENLPNHGKRDSPLLKASFFSKIFYTWMERFLQTCHDKTLEPDDFPKLSESRQARTVNTLFDNNWEEEEYKQKMKLTKSKKSDLDTKVYISLLKVIFKTYKLDLFLSSFLRLIVIGMEMARPSLLGCLIDLAEDSSKPIWKGFVYLVAFLFCNFMDEVCMNYAVHISCMTKMRIRANGINAIYRKEVGEKTNVFSLYPKKDILTAVIWTTGRISSSLLLIYFRGYVLREQHWRKSFRLTNSARSTSTVGEMVNLISTDLEHMQHMIAFGWWCWAMPTYVVVCFFLLYQLLGVGALAGLAVLIVMMPLHAFNAKKSQTGHKERMDKKDKRIELLTEIINGIKILKLYAWELVFGDRILKMRQEELELLKKQRMYNICGTLAYNISPFLMCIFSLGTYVYLNEDHVLTAHTAFSALAILQILNCTFATLPHVYTNVSKAIISAERITKFLNNEEMDTQCITHDSSENAISIENGTFTWDKNLGPVLKDINMNVPKGSLVAIVGRVGTGKSSIVSSLLGEVKKDKGKINVDGRIAYVPQQAWIQNDTLQNNVLFGKRLNPETYKAVLDACALTKDLEILPGKDQTEIGEKGINLSGGQKQRVSMARAVYHNADIYLLDDPLSAVDSQVGKHMFEHVIGSKGFLRNKTRVLITHGLTWLPEVDKIFVMNGGVIAESGSYKELMGHNGAFAKFIKEYKQQPTLDEEWSDEEDPETATCKYEKLIADSGYQSTATTDNDNSDSDSENQKFQKNYNRSISRALSMESKTLPNENEHDDELSMGTRKDDKDKGKFVDEDEIETGKVQLKYILPYIKAIGKSSCFVILLLFALFKFNEIVQQFWIKEWTNDEGLQNLTLMTKDSEERMNSNIYYVGMYAVIGLFQAIALLTHEIVLAYAIVKAATSIHEILLKNVLRGKMSFFDSTPLGRIVSRFSQDMEPLDGEIAHHTEWFLHVTFGLISIFFVIIFSIPKFVIMVIPVTVVYLRVRKYFVPARRQLSRLVSKKRSPMFSHFSESLNGTSVIRAYGCQERFSLLSEKKVDEFNMVLDCNNSIDRWMFMKLNKISWLCIFVTTMFSLFERDILGGAVVGLLLNYANRMHGELNGLVRVSGEIESSVVSIERIGQYSSRDTEAPLHTETTPPEEWPNKGIVNIKDLSLKYKPDTPLVLKNISLDVKQGEKIGIVGRTGAGKSSLTLGLFRLIEHATGSVHIDEYNISDLGLFDLRRNLTILPQDPVLFSGTLRTNLDPVDEYTDAEIFNVLEHAHLKSFIIGLPDKLEYKCGEGGQNLSIGQRQLICLARSLLRKSKVLILDEATAAVDMKTDELIQNTIKKEFKECTVFTIAHRLNTILDYDRILVLSHGEVHEFDHPKTLLQNKESMFYSMAKDANIVL